MFWRPHLVVLSSLNYLRQIYPVHGEFESEVLPMQRIRFVCDLDSLAPSNLGSNLQNVMFEQWKEHGLIASNQWKSATVSVQNMARVSPPGPEHEQLTRWARSQGVRINGVGPAKISGSGLGIVAQRRIEAGEELVNVPASALLTVNSISKRFRALHEGITVHGLLASFLAFGGSKKSYYGPWAATWPSLKEFKESMPLLWSGKLSQMLGPDGKSSATHRYHEASPLVLPPAIGGRWQLVPSLSKVSEDVGLLNQQARKFGADWNIVSRIFPDKFWEDYAYYWLIVNTRGFYFELSDATNIPQADRMVMCPFIDYFNHNDHGCDVTFDQSGYTVISDRAYDVGQELQTSYGSHSNDVLLCDYGFILQSNRFDYVSLDDLFGEHMMSSKDTESLEAAGYLGNYTLTSEGVCFRTEVAIRSVTLNTQDWKEFMAGTFDETELSKSQAAAVLQRDVLQLYEKEAEEALQHLAKEKVHEMLTRAEKREVASKIPRYATELLLRRWKQILDLIHGNGNT